MVSENLFCIAILSILYTALGQGRLGGIKKPLTLGPGEVPEQKPGWNHCIHRFKVGKGWRPIKSPGYPIFSGTQLQCSWMLEAPLNFRIKLAFRDLNMAPQVGGSCNSQYVKLVDQYEGKSQGKFCGKKPPGDYVSIGTRMRIDIQGDKSTVNYKGFFLYAVISKEPAGFRTTRTFQPLSSGGGPSKSGRVNKNDFTSYQKQQLSTKPKNPIFPSGLILKYASDLRVSEEEANAAKDLAAGEGWLTYASGRPTPRGPRAGGVGPPRARPKPQYHMTVDPLEPNRFRAKIHRTVPATTTTASPPAVDHVDDYPDEHAPDDDDMHHYFGENHQPRITLPPVMDEAKGYVVEEAGLSTLHLIIIAVCVVLCVLIISAVFLIKKCCIDKPKPLNEKELAAAKEEDRPALPIRLVSLPGLDPKLLYKTPIRKPTDDDPPVYHNLPLYQTAHEVFATQPQSLQPGGAMRHKRPGAEMTMEGAGRRASLRSNGISTLPSKAQRISDRCSDAGSRRPRRDVRFQRPLPAVPPTGDMAATVNTVTEKASGKVETDEDYCSGAEDDLGTLKRVYSTWEMEEKNRKPVTACE